MGLRREQSSGLGKFSRKNVFIPKTFATQKFFMRKIPGKIFFKPKKSGSEIFQAQKFPTKKISRAKIFKKIFYERKKVYGSETF